MSESEKNIDALVDARAQEIRANKKFDPRREQELNDIYNQYIPPYSVQETSHLLDVAERSAYIDPFPPTGSQKMAGAVIKKSVRIVVGWYMQYVAQQISTFGSSVAGALRSINNDVIELKKKVETGNIAPFIDSLDLDSSGDADWKHVGGVYDGTNDATVIVSQGISEKRLAKLAHISHVVVVDPRSEFCAQLPATTDSRIAEIAEHLKGYEDSSVDGVVIHGRTLALDVATRISTIKDCARVVKGGAAVVFVIPKKETGLVTAREITGSPMWSAETWEHMLSVVFGDVEKVTATGSVVLVAKNTLSPSEV